MSECAQGKGVRSELLEAILSISSFRMVEDEVEGLHRNVKIESSRAPATQVPWASSTQTLKEILAYVEAVEDMPRGPEVFCREWHGYKRLLQMPGKTRRQLWRPRRVFRPVP